MGFVIPEGVSKKDFAQEQAKLFAERHPHLRPCGKHHGIAVKATCRKCPECVGIIEE